MVEGRKIEDKFKYGQARGCHILDALISLNFHLSLFKGEVRSQFASLRFNCSTCFGDKKRACTLKI
jgi:hypothetical protein